MTHVAITTATEPDGAPRIASLDVLRGIAILGILFMNINDMGGSIWAFWAGDIRHLGWTTADQIAWWMREVFANGTARCMLEMLFGVGMVILTDRASKAIEGAAGRSGGRLRRVGRWLFGDGAVLRAYYWRNFVLFLFGVVHMFILLWPGDILHTYGLAALVAFLFRRLGPKWLLGIGLSMGLLQFGFGGYAYVTRPGERAQVAQLEAQHARGVTPSKEDAETLKTATEAKSKRAERKAKEQARIVAEDKERGVATGTFRSWAKSAWDFTLALQAKALEIAFVLEAATTMLIGAALYKWGIIQGGRSRQFYLLMTLAAYAIGLGCRASGAFVEMRFDDSRSIMWPMGELSRLATTLGHVGLAHLLLGSLFGAKLLKPFEAVGKTALTIYILQTIVCLWILYPPFALGLYGTQGWAALMLTALAINAALLVWANWWVRHYRIAPVEWAWRSIVERKLLPMRKRGRVTGPDLATQPA